MEISAVSQIKNVFKQISSPLMPGSPTTQNAIDYLKAQHREVEQLFTKIESLGNRATKAKFSTFLTLAEKVLMHSELEEKFFYPELKEIDADLFFEATEEHSAVADLIAKIRKLGMGHETFDAKVKFLKELIEHHVKEEEKDLFPRWESEDTEEEIQAAGRRMIAAAENFGAKSARKKANVSQKVLQPRTKAKKTSKQKRRAA